MSFTCIATVLAYFCDLQKCSAAPQVFKLPPLLPFALLPAPLLKLPASTAAQVDDLPLAAAAVSAAAQAARLHHPAPSRLHQFFRTESMDNSNMDQDKNQSDEPAMDQDKNQSDEPAIDCDANNVEGEKTGSRTKRSFVWDHFTYVDGSNKMKECVDFEKITCKIKPCLDVETRWNSTFLMLETAVKYSKAFDRLQAIDKNYQSYFSTIEVNDIGGGDDERNTRKRKKNDRVLGAPDEDDWENARHFIEYLKIFHDVTKRVSGSKYVTSNLFVGELVTMHATISHMCSNGDEKKKKMALLMKEKYDKYWENLDNMNFLLHVALVLDPRNKMSFLKYCLGLIYGMNSVKCKSVVKKVEDTLIELFDHYKNKMDNMNEQSPTSSSTPTAVNLNIHDGYQKYLEEHGGGVKATELDTYLTDGIEKMIIGDEIFDVLGWWKQQSVKFPILSQMAKHVLGMPISTVASESAFSMGGRVIDKFRSSLTPKTAEALICTQDWLRSTPADLQEIPVNGLSLEDLMENLEKIENDLNLKGKKPINDFFVDLEEE